MNRRYNVDVLRIISALAVITIHVVTAPVGNAGGTVSYAMREQLNLIHNLMMWSVPVFFMITGYCLIKKEECTYRYCLRHVLKYVAVLFTVGFFYALLEQIFQRRTFSLKIIGTSIVNVVNGNLWEHMWFVYTIIGIYLVMPVVHSFMKQNPKDVFILTGLLFVFTILWPIIGHWFSIWIEFPFGSYLFYVCFGGAVANCKLKKNVVLLICSLGAVATLSLIVRGGNVVLSFKSLEVALMAMGVFIMIEQFTINQNKYIALLADCAWGIYLIHPFFVNLILKVLKIDLLGSAPYIRLMIFEVVLVVIGFAVTYVLKKIPVIKLLF